MRLDLEEPESWPANVSWDVYRKPWARVVLLARAWMEGRVRDPCRGRSWHWGGPMDRRREVFEPVDCGPTANIFYRVRARNR